MATTVSTMMTRVRRRIEDVQGIHWSDAEVIAAINESKNDLYDMISLRNRDVLPTISTEYVWSANTMSVDLGAIFPAYEVGTFDVLLVSVLPNNSQISADNPPIPLYRKNFEELYRHGRGFSRFYGDFVDEQGNSDMWSGGSTIRYSNVCFAIQGSKMFLDPVPRNDIRLRIQIVRRFREYAEDGTDKTLPVFPDEERIFQRYQRIIEYMSALVLKGRSDEQSDPVLLQLNQKMTLLNSWLDQQSTHGTPRVVVDGY